MFVEVNFQYTEYWRWYFFKVTTIDLECNLWSISVLSLMVFGSLGAFFNLEYNLFSPSLSRENHYYTHDYPVSQMMDYAGHHNWIYQQTKVNYRDYTQLRRGKKGNVISGRYALIGSWLITKISQVCDKSSESILQRVLSEGWSEGR